MENRWICMTPRSRLTHTILYKLFPQHLSIFDSTDFNILFRYSDKKGKIAFKR